VILFLLKQRKPDIHVSRHSLDRLKTADQLQTGKRIQLTGQFSLMRDRSHYQIIENQSDSFSEAILSKKKMDPPGYTTAGLSFALSPCDFSRDENSLCLDLAKMSWPVTLRRWRDGDRFQPLGMRGRQLVSDHLTNRKVGAAEKQNVLVVDSFEETICAVIF